MNKTLEKQFPVQLVVETTAACNQDCIFCGRTYMDRPKKTMPLWMWERIVTEIGAKSPLTELWPAFMGEAMLLENRLFDMLKIARRYGCQKITLNTNGTRLNKITIPRLLEGSVDRLIVSCDAHTPETHERIRPGRHTYGLKGIYAGVKEIIRQKEELRIVKPIIEMQFSVFDENEHEREDFISCWRNEGVVVKIRPKVYWSGTVSGGGHRTTTGAARLPCYWSFDTACIHWNGNIVMCAIDSEGKYIAGNIEASSIQSVWTGPLAWIRELHRRHRFRELPEICRRCPDWQVKKAKVYFPDSTIKKIYEGYINLGRNFTPEHFWSAKAEVTK